MTPAARLQASIELLDALLETNAPADQTVATFLRARRYIGGGDRRAILDRVYGVLRARAKLGWWLDRLGTHTSGRTLVLAALALIDGAQANSIGPLFDGQRFSPEPLTAPERRLLDALEGETLVHPDQPLAVRLEIPDWAEAPLRERFGEDFEREVAELNKPAPTDLRVNALAGTRDEAKAALAATNIEARPTKYSPLGLRLDGRFNLPELDSFKSGLIEVQDEGSQLIALLTDAKPGMRVVDFCAGAGGKTLALAAAMDNRGSIVACDVVKGRIDRAGTRLRRAGVHNVQRRVIEGARDPWIKRHAGGFDRVLVDAPCTGSGTWRRNPDQRWRMGPESLASLQQEQAEILDGAARLVKRGGRLVYATCSFFRAENEEQVEGFIARHPDFALLPVGATWDAILSGECPATGPMLTLTPARHGTDGFFLSILERKAASET